MTDQHTFESPAEYTPEEQIEALRRLGAEFSANHIKIGERTLFGRDKQEVIAAAHEFLRTDESAWMAMDWVLSRIRNQQTVLFTDFADFDTEGAYYGYSVECYDEPPESRIIYSGSAATRQAAVYDCFMEFIREELKKK